MSELVLLETMLPARFLVSYAVYVQTCAHLELAAWQIVLVLTGRTTTDANSLKAALAVRRNTWSILDELRDSAHLAPLRLIPALKALEVELRAGMVNRNLAVHGAWYIDKQDGQLKMEHYWQDYQTKEWLHLDRPIKDREIREAVIEVDRLFKEAARIRAALLAEQSSHSAQSMND